MLENIDLILASQSPRRKELLTLIKQDFDIIPSHIEEVIPNGMETDDIPVYLSAQKALDIAKTHPHAMVIGCDTVVVLEDIIMGKPKDREEAYSMLRRLSGRTHKVVSGVCLCYRGRTLTFSETTLVSFYELSDDEIYDYIETGSPFDKAGGYGIQDRASLFVKKIDGDYYNVVGLPVGKLNRTIKTLLEMM